MPSLSARRTPIILANAHIEIRIDPGNGRIIALRNITQDLDLIERVFDAPPWRLELDRRGWIEHFSNFSFSLEEEKHAVTLRWQTEFGVTLVSYIEALQDEPSLRLTIRAENKGDLVIDKIEYPYIGGVGSLVRPSSLTCLVHSQGTGFLFRDPVHTFAPEAGRGQGLRYSPYPEGFNGSSMQFMAYYAEQEAEKRGGFYFATRDQGKSMKWYNCFKDIDSAALFISLIHQNPALVGGQDFAPDYPIEISALVEGSWYEAADRYKRWAVEQSWTKQGRLAERRERARWLLEDVGICIFGVNAVHDRSAWLNAFHQMAGRPVFHILGPNWARSGQDYMNTIPAGALEEWLPANLSSENLQTIRANGDYWAPFEFDLLCSHLGRRPEPVLESRMVLPKHKYGFDRYVFPFMCPATDFWHDFHVERDRAFVAANAPDSIYYDISVNNVLMACRSPHHNHRPGGGAEIVDAFAAMFADTKAAMAVAAGRYMPLGAEMITELMIPAFDYYQARAEASPVSNFEADFWRQWLIEGSVEKIPLFAYVYHEYGPVRMDGWAKLSPEVGDIFYWVAARVTLWGGLFELNYEFSGLEVLDGKEDDPGEHYWHFTPRAYTIDPAKAAFVGEVARTRTGWANPYLAYGKMISPPPLEISEITLSYFLYNCGQNVRAYEEHGEITVPSVVCSAWNYQGEKAAILLVNLQTEAQSVSIPLELAHYGLEPGQPYSLFQIADDKAVSLGVLQPYQEVMLTLPSRKFVGLEMRRV